MNVATHLGHGYDVFNKKILTDCVYVIDESGNDSDVIKYGIKVPKGVFVLDESRTETYNEIFHSELALTKHHLGKLGILGDINITKFNSKLLQGKEKITNERLDQNKCLTSFRQEKVLFCLQVNEREIQFSDNFKFALNKLPKDFEEEDHESVTKFEGFFKAWGYYVIYGSYGGGVIEVKIEGSSDLLRKSDNLTESTKIDIDFQSLIKGKLKSNSETKECLTNKSSFKITSIKFKGGDPKYHKTKEDCTEENQWIESLVDQPLILDSQFKLTHMWRTVEKLAMKEKKYLQLSEAVQKAQEYFLGKYEKLNEQSAHTMHIKSENNTSLVQTNCSRPLHCNSSTAKVVMGGCSIVATVCLIAIFSVIKRILT